MAQYYNRYTQFSINGQSQTVPFVSIPSKTSDKKVIYKLGKSRMDKLGFQNTEGLITLMLNELRDNQSFITMAKV